MLPYGNASTSLLDNDITYFRGKLYMKHLRLLRMIPTSSGVTRNVCKEGAMGFYALKSDLGGK